MSELIITESSIRKNNLTYLYGALGEMINQVDARVDIKNGKNRYELKIFIPDEYNSIFLTETEDKIADVIAINYKYNYFRRNAENVFYLAIHRCYSSICHGCLRGDVPGMAAGTAEQPAFAWCRGDEHAFFAGTDTGLRTHDRTPDL